MEKYILVIVAALLAQMLISGFGRAMDYGISLLTRILLSVPLTFIMEAALKVATT